MKSKWITASLLTIGVASAGAAALSAQQRPERPDREGGQTRGPSQAMLSACEGKSRGDVCSVDSEDGEATAGVCRAPRDDLPPACVPEGARQSDSQRGGQRGGQRDGAAAGPPRGQSNSGTPIAATQTYTIGVLCGYAVDTTNAQTGLPAIANWNCERGQRKLVANGVPDHAIGQFPNPGNPNVPSVQSVSFAVTTSPIATTGPGGAVKEPVMGLNGIKFDPGTGGSCSDTVQDSADCPLGPGGGGRWNIEALGQDLFDFGEDLNNAHVQPGGMYHYHGVPVGMLSEAARDGKQMQMIGWAADGFPVYARYGFPKAGIMFGDLKLMQPSYRMKASPDEGRPSTDIVPMGAFQQDWEYVEGLGDLDECNGRFGSTPEFPEGVYHYYATDAYPYVQRCVKGSIESQPEAEQRGQGRGERRQRGGRGGRGGDGERSGERGGGGGGPGGN